MTNAARYVTLVEWSEEDQAYVGQCPGIIGPCCHGTDAVEVYRELGSIVDEWLAHNHRAGIPLPAPTAGTGVAAKMA